MVRTEIKMLMLKAGIVMLSSGKELKMLKLKVGVEMLSSGQELKMLKLKQELKISNLFLRGSIGSEGKMNDKRMISQTPTVHKLDEVSSLCLADYSKYVRESVKKSE